MDRTGPAAAISRCRTERSYSSDRPARARPATRQAQRERNEDPAPGIHVALQSPQASRRRRTTGRPHGLPTASRICKASGPTTRARRSKFPIKATTRSSMPAISMAPAAAPAPSAFLTDTAGRQLTKATSLVVDPPNGRVPIMPWAERDAKLQAGAHSGRLGEFHAVGAVYHSRRAGRDLPGRLRLGVPDPAGSRATSRSSTR